MKRQLLIFGLAMFAIIATNAQETQKEEFKPSGKATGKVFFNFNHDFTEGATKTNAFELNRAYFGYNYNFNEAISAKVLLDGSKTSPASEYTVFIKNAELDWKLNSSAVLQMGMIGLKQIDTQEKFWGYRYVNKEFADEFGFGTTADIGGNLEYTFSPKVMANLFVINGEGFTSAQDANGNMKFGTSVVYTPIEGLTFKGYYSIYGIEEKDAQGVIISENVNIQNFDFFAGYKNDKFRVSVGQYLMLNGKTYKQAAKDYVMAGTTLSGAVSLTKKYELFGQIMNLQSNTIDGAVNSWNYNQDGSIIITGIQYSPVKGVKTALNVRNYSHANSAIKNYTALYMNLEFSF
jgi:hypothetical protein